MLLEANITFWERGMRVWIKMEATQGIEIKEEMIQNKRHGT